MTRKSVYDLLNKYYDVSFVCRNLLIRFKKQQRIEINDLNIISTPDMYTCEEYFNNNILECKWKGYSVCFDEILNNSHIDTKSASFTTETCITIIELLYNCFSYINMISVTHDEYPASKSVQFDDDLKVDQELCDKMIDNLHLKKLPPNKDGFVELVDVSPAEVMAAESLTDDEKKLQLLRYHHHLLQGDLSGKQAILKSLADVVEPMRKELNANNYKSIADDLFFMLNRAGIRHNNDTGTNETFWSNLNDTQKEELYDKTFDLIVDCIGLHEYLSGIKPEIELLKKPQEGNN